MLQAIAATAATQVKPIDVLQARVIQARAAASMLQGLYSDRSASDRAAGEHPMSAQCISDALWAIGELLDQACGASDAFMAAEGAAS